MGTGTALREPDTWDGLLFDKTLPRLSLGAPIFPEGRRVWAAVRWDFAVLRTHPRKNTPFRKRARVLGMENNQLK